MLDALTEEDHILCASCIEGKIHDSLTGKYIICINCDGYGYGIKVPSLRKLEKC